MNSLQEQIRQLAHEPQFIEHFLHEGAYVFAEEQPTEVSAEAVELLSNAASTAATTSSEKPTAPPKLEELPAAGVPVPSEALPVAPEKVIQKSSETPSWIQKVVVLLPPEPSIKEVQLLHKILAASGITDDQVSIQEKLFQAKSLGQFAGSRIVLSFGAVTDFQADYQLRSKAITVIMADKLAHIEADVEAKKKLWAVMKSFFS